MILKRTLHYWLLSCQVKGMPVNPLHPADRNNQVIQQSGISILLSSKTMMPIYNRCILAAKRFSTQLKNNR
jgi:hypothetical protein